MIGWLADALQLAWGLLYWNLRKSWFRWRHGRVPCPCQNPSDSGHAMETGCEPSFALSEPKRFRHVCPLLKPDAQGRWRCSVDTPNVRPFWGRALAIFVLCLGCLYVALTTGAWSLLRARGYKVGYGQIAWPGAWSHFHEVQSRFFAEKAQRALAQHDVGEAVMSLSIAYQLDRQNYPLGLLFARLTQGSQPGLSDQVYAELAQNHPAHQLEVFGAWYEALLWRADFHGIVALSREALGSDRAHANAWLNALLFALRRQPDEGVEQALAAQTTLSDVHDVFALDLRTLKDGATARTALLTPPPPHATAFFNYYLPKRLIEVGAGRDAIDLLTSGQLQLAPRDRLTLLFEAYTDLGWRPILQQQLTQLLAQPLNSPANELLAAYLIRHPDREFLASAFDTFKYQVPSDKDVAYREWAGWLCAAGASGDFVRYEEAAQEMKKLSGSELRTLAPLEAFFQGNSAHARIESFLPAMQPLPLDVTYALLERYYRAREAAPPTS